MKNIDEQLVCELYKKHGFTKIAEMLGTYPLKISRILDKLGIEKRRMGPLVGNVNSRKYNLNTRFFYDYHDETFIYFLGLLYADGNNDSATNHCICIGLQESDADILEKINKIVYGNQKPLKIYSPSAGSKGRKNMVVLAIYNKEISDHLHELGLMPNKTFKLVFPRWLGKDMHRHFIRGYFDGDGCITIQYKYSNRGVFRILGTYRMMSSFSKIIHRQCGVNATMKSRGEIFELRVAGNIQILRVFKWMYKDSNIYMDRKYCKFVELFGELK